MARKKKINTADVDHADVDHKEVLDNFKVGQGWLYHETKEPKIFMDGEKCTGWNVENRKLWKFDSCGKWMKNDNIG